ncbi:MAG: carboxypeptidase regulatory-like domain-containing protein, partial [Acidobacteria bacterium]|nr:carboxypeptidase regulatory-like domain-containing protein [Acidobacteriota bacterium]MCI0718918.1 carboxypeptidase regulatory-like domain-containing protein [Acidobacteriota bacterium]
MLFLLCGLAQGQTSRGAVTGTLTDASKAVIAGSSVVLTHSETGVRRSASSNEAGLYRFDAVDPGVYQLKVTHPGFKPSITNMVQVNANRVTTIDLRLEVGTAETVIQVSAESEDLLAKDGPLRGGNFLPREVKELPLIGLNPISLARTLPGVIQPLGTFLQSGEESTEFSVNGQRVRGNNFLLDGTENNDIAFTGMAQPFSIADAVEEVSVQTGNFSVEFGRASGGVFNVITKAGTNEVHGTLFWRYQSQRFNSVSNVDKLAGIPKSVFSHNVPGFTVGGPIRKGRTFFFGGFQQDTRRSTANFTLVVPTAASVERLRSLFPSNPRLDLYLGALGDLRGTGAPFPQALGVDPQTGVNRGSVLFATASLGLRQTNEGPQWLVRVDHHQSEAHRLSWRYIRDSRMNSPVTVNFPGFILDSAERNQNFLFTDGYTFGPSYTNEFRFSYGRLDADQTRISPQSVPQARTLPWIRILNPTIAAPGVTSALQFRHANNLLFQETQTKLIGRHTVRYGMELLWQRATQRPNAITLGEYRYFGGGGYSAFANFLDDYSGANGRIIRSFGAEIFHPNQFRQSYFFQDTWKATPSLTLTLGLRYENFGQLANALRYPAFAGFDPARFLEPNQVNRDDNNFGPAFGLAWSPSFASGWLGKLFGNQRTVWRGGYQISYQALYSQILSLELASSTPNAILVDLIAASTGRGDPNWFARLPTAAGEPDISKDQHGAIEKNLSSPYTERWSFGFQRQLLGQALLDVSYVGAQSHKLTTRADFNPRQPSGERLHPDYGQRTVRTSQGNSAYHALQARLDRRFAQGFQLAASYTRSRSLDSTSEGIGQVNSQYASPNLTSVPAAQGGLKLDRGLSDFHRGHRLSLLYLWEVPGPSKGWWKHLLGGWSLAGITTFQSGTPYTIVNGSDRNLDGWQMDRPDIANPTAPRNSRAVIAQSCATGYRNPDTGACVRPS